jgi:hypothetical protein
MLAQSMLAQSMLAQSMLAQSMLAQSTQLLNLLTGMTESLIYDSPY